jgi:transposase-like protein
MRTSGRSLIRPLHASARVFNRDDLYSLVWSKTMRDAAKDYRISDTALKKICRKLNVPTPPQGYWLRRASDRGAARVELPKLRDGASAEFFTVAYQQNDSIPPSNAATERALAEITSDRIEVAPVLVEPNRLVARTAKLLAKAKPSDGLVSARSRRGLDVAVAPASVERAMRIMDALLKALGDRELTVEVTPESEGKIWGRTVYHSPIAHVRVEDEWIRFSLPEALKVAPPPPEPPKQRTEMTDEERWKPRPRPERRVRTATGTLVLTIETGQRHRHWRDRSRRKLEMFLNDFVAHLYVAADWLKQDRKRIEEERLRQEEVNGSGSRKRVARPRTRNASRICTQPSSSGASCETCASLRGRSAAWSTQTR